MCIIFLWIACATLSHGILFAHLQREYPKLAEKDYSDDLIISFIISLLFGPLAFFAALLMVFCTSTFKHGLKFI